MIERYRIEKSGSLLLPLGSLPERLDQLDAAKDIVTVCHHGTRSLHALGILKNAGYTKVRSLRGGVDAWSIHVDPKMPRY